MVDGITGFLDLAVKHVAVEDRISLESVTDLNLHVMEKTVMGQNILLTQLDAIMSAVLVSGTNSQVTMLFIQLFIC